MSNKKRVMMVLRYLQEFTNEEHNATSEKIIGALHKCGVVVDRKTIYNDIRSLNEMNYTIEKSANGYYYNGEVFELPELKILIDGIKANGFLPKKKTEQIVKKLLSLTNSYDRKLADSKQKITVSEGNEAILYNIDTIVRCIDSKNAINFYYYDLDISKKKVYRKNKKKYQVYPYDLVVDNNRYYLICNTIGHEGLSHYRLDKMEKVEKVESLCFEKAPDLTDYLQSTFSMYLGETKVVTLKCQRKLYEDIEKKWGKLALVTESIDEESFECNVKVNISPTFYSWVFSYSGQIQIIEPAEVRNEFIQLCQQMIKSHLRQTEPF